MRISFINGVCVKNDAISNAIRDEIVALRGKGFDDVRLFAYDCQHEQLPFSRVKSVTDICFDRHFQSSDLVIFHFGVYYPLFDLLAMIPKPCKRLVVFHNITPKEFLPSESHATIDKSFAQMSNIAWADHVICDSETNLAVLRAHAIMTPATVLPLAVRIKSKPPAIKPGCTDGITRLSFVGRFVKSKGPDELLAALEMLMNSNSRLNLQLDMVGNLLFSDQGFLEKVQHDAQRLVRQFKERLRIRFHGNASEETKQQILSEADLFVLPTYHEGFCVPILEAMASGCRVVAYNNSNTPAISGGLATLTPTGDVAALAQALKESVAQFRSEEWCNTGPGSYSEYVKLVQEHLQQFSPDLVEDRFAQFVANFMN